VQKSNHDLILRISDGSFGGLGGGHFTAGKYGLKELSKRGFETKHVFRNTEQQQHARARMIGNDMPVAYGIYTPCALGTDDKAICSIQSTPIHIESTQKSWQSYSSNELLAEIQRLAADHNVDPAMEEMCESISEFKNKSSLTVNFANRCKRFKKTICNKLGGTADNYSKIFEVMDDWNEEWPNESYAEKQAKDKFASKLQLCSEVFSEALNKPVEVHAITEVTKDQMLSFIKNHSKADDPDSGVHYEQSCNPIGVSAIFKSDCRMDFEKKKGDLEELKKHSNICKVVLEKVCKEQKSVIEDLLREVERRVVADKLAVQTAKFNCQQNMWSGGGSFCIDQTGNSQFFPLVSRPRDSGGAPVNLDKGRLEVQQAIKQARRAYKNKSCIKFPIGVTKQRRYLSK
jgi:hypothetical protein